MDIWKVTEFKPSGKWYTEKDPIETGDYDLNKAIDIVKEIYKDEKGWKFLLKSTNTSLQHIVEIGE